VIAATPPDHRQIMSAKGVIPDEIDLFGWKSQQLLSLGGDEQLATTHKSFLENLGLRETDPEGVKPSKKVAFAFSKTILDSFFSFFHL
jgi:hypothetical protein